MTTDTNRIASTRKHFLAALNDPQLDTALLHSMVKELKTTQADLLVPYLADDNYDPIQGNPSKWNDQYFSQQKTFAQRNFSLERLEHLIQVRERFRQEGRKGFVAKAQTAAAARHAQPGDGFRPSNNLAKFVEEGDLATVRTALGVDLEDSRLDAQALRAALAWAKSCLPGLCEPYTEKAFARAIEHDRQKWTRDYYNKQVVYLDTNFAEERYLHLTEVREYLRQQGTPKPASAPASRPVPAPAPAAATPRPAAAPRPAATPAADETPARPQPQPPRPAPGRQGLSPVLLAALLIGGALAAVAILILVLRK